MPEIIIFSGIPCSGKSSFREKLKNHKVICRDDIRNELSNGKKWYYSRDNENRVTDVSNYLFVTAIEKELNILIDNTHCKDAYIQEWIKRAPKEYTIKIKFFDISLFEAHLRNIIRRVLTGKWIPLKVMNDMYRNYKKLDKKKYENYLFV